MVYHVYVLAVCRENGVGDHGHDDGLHNAFHHLSPDDLGKLLDSDDVYLDLDIPDNLFGPDGHVLLDTDFGGNPKDDHFVDPHNAQQQQQHHQHQNHEQTLDAARSVLASLDSTMQQDHSNMTMQHAHSAPQMTGVPMHGGNMGTYAAMNTHQQQQQQQQPMFIRDAQGNFVQVNNPPMQPMYLSGVPYQPGHVHYFVHHQQVPSMSYGHVPVYDQSGSVQNSPRKSPGKRRRQRKSTETVQQRSARAESGYTQDPLTGHMLRHGPALMATARDNKEVPAIKAMFQTFDKSGGFSQPPSSPFVGVQLGDADQSAAAAAGIKIEADATGAPVGNQSITTRVTQELRSFTPKDVDAQDQDASTHTAAMKGVTRDKWSLFWDAHFERPSPKSDGGDGEEKGSLVDELKKDIIFIGKFPAKDQAARAHDLVALKLLGEDAELNFPRETYRTTLPIVQAHTEEEVLRAILKDSELARQRTSKYKGVRRTGPGQYEALIDAEVASGKHAMSEPQCHLNTTIHVPHNTETFNA